MRGSDFCWGERNPYELKKEGMESREAQVLRKPVLAQSGLVILTKYFTGTEGCALQFATKKNNSHKRFVRKRASTCIAQGTSNTGIVQHRVV